MASDLTHPTEDDPIEDVDTLRAQLPTEADQDLLDYAHGADLSLPGLIDYIKMNGALAGMVERQSRTIAAYALEIRQLKAALRVALLKAGAS